MFVVWGKIKESNAPEIKLISFNERTIAVNWMRQNKKYYDDMIIRKGK